MAHRTKIEKVPYLKQDGTISPGKYRYLFSCKCRGKVCVAKTEFSSKRAAEEELVAHHMERYAKSQGKKNQPTPKRPPTVHPARRAERVKGVQKMSKGNAALDAIRDL